MDSHPPLNSHPPRNLGLDLVRVTEAAALAAGRFLGFGDSEAPNRAAVDAMVGALNTLDMDGHIVIGEEGRLGARTPLDTGERVGTADGPAMDVVVNPIDGRALVANFKTGALAVAAVGPRGAMWRRGPLTWTRSSWTPKWPKRSCPSAWAPRRRGSWRWWRG